MLFPLWKKHFLDYFVDPVPDGAVVYVGDVLFQYNKREGSIALVGNPTGIIFEAAKRDHEFLLNQKGNTSNMSNNSNNCRKLNAIENSRNLMQIAATNSGDMSHLTYNAWKRDADADYWSRVDITIKELCKWY